MNYKAPLFAVLSGLLTFRTKYFPQGFVHLSFSSLYVGDYKPVKDNYHSLLDFKIKDIAIFRKARNYRARQRNGRFLESTF